MQPSAHHAVGRPAAIRALEALGIVWPAAALSPLLAQSAALISASGSTQAHEERPSQADALALAQYRHAYGAALSEARRAFAGANGWRLAVSPFSVDQLRTGRPGRRAADYAAPSLADLAFPHPDAVEYFRTARRRPVALVLHSERDITPAPIAGVSLVQLPASWFSPRGATAYLLARVSR